MGSLVSNSSTAAPFSDIIIESAVAACRSTEPSRLGYGSSGQPPIYSPGSSASAFWTGFHWPFRVLEARVQRQVGELWFLMGLEALYLPWFPKD